MRIYSDCRELMSEMGRNLWEMGLINKPKSYQNKVVEGNEDFITKELICEQYCLTSLKHEDFLFTFSRDKEWAFAELDERIHDSSNPGDAWRKRKDVWEQFLVEQKNFMTGEEEKVFDYTYPERIHYSFSNKGGVSDNLIHVIKELKKNPDTRQAIIPIYSLDDPQWIGGIKRVPCSMYYDFLIRDDGKGGKQLNICYHQRSSDFVTHFGNDVWLAYKLMEYIAKDLGVKPGYLYHTIDSIHSYKKDWDKLKTSIDILIK